MNFKDYDKFIENHKYYMLHFIIYYNLKCSDRLYIENLNEQDLIYLIGFIHKAYLKSEHYMDLSHICDIALYYKKDILKKDVNSFNTWDLLIKCDETREV